MHHIYWLITILLLAVFVTFTVFNLDPVVIDFWPFEYQLHAPFALVVLGCLLIGFLIGAFLMWLRFGAARARARRAEARAASLERQLVDLKRSTGAAAQPVTGAPQLSSPAGGYKAVSGGN